MGANATAARQVVERLRSAGKVTSADGARVAAFLSLAEAVDACPSNAQLWREYRMIEAALRDGTSDDTDEFREVTAALSAPVGDAAQP